MPRVWVESPPITLAILNGALSTDESLLHFLPECSAESSRLWLPLQSEQGHDRFCWRTTSLLLTCLAFTGARASIALMAGSVPYGKRPPWTR